MAFERLTSLEVHHVYDLSRVTLLTSVLAKCKELKHLALGFDKIRLDMDMESKNPGSAANFDFLRTQMLLQMSGGGGTVGSDNEDTITFTSPWENLESLSLSEISVRFLSAVVALQRLKSLALSECDYTDNFLQQCSTDTPNLKRLYVKPVIGEAQGVVDGLGHFLETFKGLKEISYVHRAPTYEWQFKTALEGHVATLETLAVWDYPITTDSPDLRELCNKCPRLQAVAVKLNFDWLEVRSLPPSPSLRQLTRWIDRVQAGHVFE
jgi:hypothetical protein